MGDIEIQDKEAFPGKATKIRQAAVNLRAYGDEFDEILAEAKREAASFTTGGVAPVYEETITALEAWIKAVKAANGGVCDSADNCVETMTSKFTKITGSDIDYSKIVKQL